MNNEIISALMDWNPWFEGEVPKTLVGIKRELDVLSFLAIPEIKILEGVRRSGKSTLLYQVVEHAVSKDKNVLYINFDDEILSKFSLDEIYYAFLQKRKVDILLIDEVQHCKSWVQFIRKIYDRKELEQIWITGSNSSLIKKEYAELLTGRNIKITISPLSFREYLTFKGHIDKVNTPLSKNAQSLVKAQFTQYMNIGSFPAIVLRDVYQRELLNSYFEDFLFKDIATRYDVNASKLKDLAIYLATHSTKMFSYRNVAQIMKLHANTVNDYVSYMKDVFLFDEIYKFDYSLKSQHSHDKKLYMIDTGLANSVSFRFSEDKGRMLESLVYLHLKRQGHEIYFHRGKKECDFIIKKGLDITQSIQVCWSLKDQKTKEREFSGLLDAAQTFKTKNNLILTCDEEDLCQIDGEKVEVNILPVWKWMLMNE